MYNFVLGYGFKIIILVSFLKIKLIVFGIRLIGMWFN